MPENAGWKSLSISYIASSRTDFVVGNFIIGTTYITQDNSILLIKASNNSVIKIEHSLGSGHTPEGDYLFSLPFISGIRTFDKNLSLEFISTSYHPVSSKLII